MRSNKQKKNKNDDFLAKEAVEEQTAGNKYTLDIPEEEIWTYQIEGLQQPHIGLPFDNAGKKKAIVVIALLVAIGLSIFLSVRVVHSDIYKYKELEDGTYELVKFSNSGSITDVTVDYVVDKETGEKDTSKPITAISEYAFNCDETINSITIGKDVNTIDGKSIYSCWWIQNVFVDPENESFCDVDGVLYSKDMTRIIFYPTDHDKYLRAGRGYADLVDDSGNPMEELWGTTQRYDELFYQTYNRDVRTYVIPSTVTEIGELAFAYSNIVDLYIPEGVKTMGNMAIFKNTVLTNIYSYKTETGVSETSYKGIDSMSEIYSSLPDGLEFIGSDCMYYTRGLSYMYIPESVTHIGHHAFWDAAYKDNGEVAGISVINVEASEEVFSCCDIGESWRPKYDYKLFKKNVDLNYSAERESQDGYNAERQYYWAVKWVENNKSDEVKSASGYLYKDINGDGKDELILRIYNEETKQTEDTALIIAYGYLDVYDGKTDTVLDDSEFTKF